MQALSCLIPLKLGYKNTHFVKYIPSQNVQELSLKTNLIKDRLEYWFSKNPAGFYKFIEPSSSPKCRVGDSWQEEIGISLRSFNKAFDSIAVRYKSKSEYLKAEDKFQGKPYLSYYDRGQRVTWYLKNPIGQGEEKASKLKSFIRYYPSLKKQTGSLHSALLIDRLEFWFAKNIHGFYKFISPSKDHAKYKPGDSWCEEIGISHKAFNHAFDLIGIRYKSKKAFEEATDKFQGMAYLSYYDRWDNRTYFLKNQEIALPAELTRQLRNGTLRSSEKSNRSYIYNITNNTPLSSSICSSQETSEPVANQPSRKKLNPNQDFDFSDSSLQNLISVWKEEIQDLIALPILTKALSTRLLDTFKSLFSECLDKWRKFCRKIASSKFLVGEKTKFKAWFLWLIKTETAERIWAGEFGVGDRISPKEAEEIANFRQKRLEEAKQKQLAERKVKEATEHQRLQEERLYQEIEAKLSKTDKEKLKANFESHILNRNDAMTASFKEIGWKTPFLDIMFEGFKKRELQEYYGGMFLVLK